MNAPCLRRFNLGVCELADLHEGPCRTANGLVLSAPLNPWAEIDKLRKDGEALQRWCDAAGWALLPTDGRSLKARRRGSRPCEVSEPTADALKARISELDRELP